MDKSKKKYKISLFLSQDWLLDRYFILSLFYSEPNLLSFCFSKGLN